MSKIYLVFNKSGSECVGFTDKRDAEEAAGLKRLGNPCSSLAEEWRELYADDEPRAKFKLVEVDLDGGQMLKALKATSQCLQECLTGGQVSAKRAGNALVMAGEVLEGFDKKGRKS